jgi:hypothetical protein
MTSIIKTIIIAFSLFIIDAFMLNQGGIALFILIIVLPLMVARTIKKRKDRVELKKRLIVMGIYAAMIIFVFVSNYLNNVIAKSRSEEIIKACERYRIRNGAYPPELSSLMPNFLKEIPTAKYTFSSNQFRYIVSADRHSLMFVSIPPFGRSYYIFEEKKWSSID